LDSDPELAIALLALVVHPMSPPITTTDFLTLVEKSGLLDSASLARYREGLKTGDAADGTSGDIARNLVADGLLTSFQARRLAKGHYHGFFIAEKYKVLEPIAEGGMGRVFLCEQLLLRRLVAVKIMTLSTKDYPGAIERFVREARATASLDHRNIARVFDVEQTSVGPCMVMEYVNGTSLQEIVYRHGPLAIDRAAHYIAQAAAGLQHAHQANLVHRDIKPENILLDISGTIKLLDLGLARFCLIEHNDNLTQRFDERAVMGTANYISPEQAANSSQVDIRADIYSLGCTFYFLLAGKPPFDGGTPAEKIMNHQTASPRSILEIRPETPKELAGVLDKMLRKRPADRFQTPADVESALAGWTEKPIDRPRPDEVQRLNPSSFRLGLSPLPRMASGRSGADVSTPRPSAARSDTQRKSDVRVVPAPPPAPTPERRFAKRRLWAISALALCALVALAWTGTHFLATKSIPTTLGGQPPPDAAALPPAGDRSRTAALPPPVPPAGMVLHAGGSSFVAPLMEHWASLYQQQSGTKIDYASLGSSNGVEGVIKHFLDFGCTDAFLSDTQLAAANGRLVHIPLVLGAVVPTYNVNDASGQPLKLRFTGPLLANIYRGLVTKWNDPTIAVNNPGKKLPDLDIHVVHRSDGSGTTSIWTDYLSKASADWKSRVGVGNRVDWPVGEGAEKNDGVADAVSRVAGAVGYVEFGYALANGLKVGQVKNKSGVFIEPSVDSVTAAAASIEEIPADLRYSLTDAPGKSSYPIAGTCWAVVFIDQPPEKRAELIKFFQWATHDGQLYVRDLRYAPLPARITSRADEAIKRLDAD
jgi:phosphate ABC transporter phosphate-binding protein